MEQWLNAIWYEGRTGSWLLRPLSLLYGLIAAARRAGYRSGWLRSRRIAAPVVVIGNLTLGGTGKTPLVIALARALAQRGLKVGVVSRGHGRDETGVRAVDGASTARQVGDEPLLIARSSGVPVVVGADRVAAAQRLVADGAQLILCDDGLQHYRLARDLEIVVIDTERGVGNGRLLPAGPLREPLSRLRGVDWIALTGAGAALLNVPLPQGTPCLGMRRRIDVARSISDASRSVPLTHFRDSSVHAVAGIGAPERFFRLLREHGIEVTEHAFPDHHPFRAEQLMFGDDRNVLMTEKDAVKCAAFAAANWWAVPLVIEWDEPDAARLVGQIAALVPSTSGPTAAGNELQ